MRIAEGIQTTLVGEGVTVSLKDIKVSVNAAGRRRRLSKGVVIAVAVKTASAPEIASGAVSVNKLRTALESPTTQEAMKTNIAATAGVKISEVAITANSDAGGGGGGSGVIIAVVVAAAAAGLIGIGIYRKKQRMSAKVRDDIEMTSR